MQFPTSIRNWTRQQARSAGQRNQPSHSTVLARPVCLFVRVIAASFPYRFPDERTPIEATPLSATSTELGLGSGLGLGLDSLSHSSSHWLPFFSLPSFHTLALFRRSLVFGGQPSPHKPRLVVSHSTCPPLSSSPHAHSFVLGTAVINNNCQVHVWAAQGTQTDGSTGATSRSMSSEKCIKFAESIWLGL